MIFPSQSLRTFFVTSVTAQRRRAFQIDERASLFLEVIATQRAKKRMLIHAFVVMPDHIHLLLTPAEDVTLEKAMQFLKGGFSFQLKSKVDVWERGFNEQRVVDATAFFAMKSYIESNPVRARFVDEPRLFPWSSAMRSELVDPTPPWFI